MMIILLYIAQLVVLFDNDFLNRSWMIDLLSLYGIDATDGKTKDWVSSTRGILPAASLFVFVWHQAFQKQLLYDKSSNTSLTSQIESLAKKMKQSSLEDGRLDSDAKENEEEEKEEEEEEKIEDNVPVRRPRRISDVASLFMKQIKAKKSRENKTRTNVFMQFLVTLLTTWRRPLRWTIQVVVYVLIFTSAAFETTSTKWLKVFHMGWRILLCILPLGLTFEPSTESTRKRRTTKTHVTLVWMYFVAFYCAVNIMFFYVMMMYPFPYEENQTMNWVQSWVDDRYVLLDTLLGVSVLIHVHLHTHTHTHIQQLGIL